MSFFNSFKKLVGITQGYDSHTTKDHFNVSVTERFGPLSNPSVIAYDSFNNILAVGAAKGGLIKVYGRPGAEFTLRSQNKGAPISSLTFVPESGHLLVASEAILEIFNLGSTAIQAALPFEAPITCVSYLNTCAFVYVGLQTGDVYLVNLDGWTRSLYRITPKDIEVQPGARNLAVVAIAINPERDDIILLGFACGAINEWEIKSHKVLRRYLHDKPLLSLAWDPSGNKFVAGHANGEIVVWTRKKSVADETYYPQLNPQKPGGLKRIFWLNPKTSPSSSSHENTIIALGGTDSPHAIAVDRIKSKQRSTIISLSEPGVELRDACAVYSYAGSVSKDAPAGPEPVGIAAVNADGTLFVHSLQCDVEDRPGLLSVNPPLPFSLSNVQVVASLALCEPLELLQDLVAVSNVDPTEAMKGQTSALAWPLSGGSFTVDPARSPLILITLMTNNTIIFWDVSMRNCRVPIYRIRLPGSYSPASPIIFDFCAVSRILHVGNGHEVFVYHFCAESRTVSLTTVDDSAQTVATVAPTASTVAPTASPVPSPQLSTADVDDSLRDMADTEKEAPPKTIILDEAKPVPPTLDDPPSASSNSSSGASTPAPNSSPSPAPKAQSPPAGPRPAMSTPNLNASKEKVTSPLPVTPSSPALARPQAVNSSAATSTSPRKRTTQTPMPSQASGFQFVYSIILEGKVIQAMTFESGLRLLAISTADGRVRIYNSAEDYARVFSYNPPANTLPCPPIITHLQFVETILPPTEEHLLLVMGLDLGSLQIISLSNPNRTFKPIAARKSPVCDVHVVRERGSVLALSKHPWLMAEEKDDYRYTPTHALLKHLIVCTVNDVRAYRIPEFEQMAQYEVPAPISWYGTITVLVDVNGKLESEFVIAAIDMGTNVYYIRLMNLTLVSYVGPNNLAKLGIEGMSPMGTTRSAWVSDGTVFIFTDNYETHIVKLVPYTEKRPITQLLGAEPPKALAKRAKGLKGLIGKDKDVNFEEVFGVRKEEPSSSAAASGSTATTSAPGNAKQPLSPGAKKVASATGDVKNVMNENMEKLNQRGQKLSDMADKSQQVAEASADFASLARQLAENQKKSWF